jgi:hypothetical protein
MKELGIRPTVQGMASTLKEKSLNPFFRNFLYRELLKAGMPVLSGEIMYSNRNKIKSRTTTKMNTDRK